MERGSYVALQINVTAVIRRVTKNRDFCSCYGLSFDRQPLKILFDFTAAAGNAMWRL